MSSNKKFTLSEQPQTNVNEPNVVTGRTSLSARRRIVRRRSSLLVEAAVRRSPARIARMMA
jgi:hypothetical protein